MAGIQLRGDTYRVYFRYNRKQYSYPVGQVTETDAHIALAKVNNWLGRIKAHLVEAPPDEKIIEFIQHDGVLPGCYQEPKPALTLAQIRDQYLDSSKARRVLGWAPAHGLADGLAATVTWYRAYLGAPA